MKVFEDYKNVEKFENYRPIKPKPLIYSLRKGDYEQKSIKVEKWVSCPIGLE